MYQRIVVGTDGSERALAAVEQAAALASATGAALHLVQGCGSAVIVSPLYGEAAGINPAELVGACTAELQPLVDELRGRDLEVTLHVVPASGRDALCSVAEEIAADLIVVGNRGMTGAKRMLGSVPNSVAHHAPCSVLIAATD
jgi:nucleotide-binding universal stress UspA family protein